MDQEILNTILQNTYSLAQYKHRLRLLKSNLLRTYFGGESDTHNPGLDEDKDELLGNSAGLSDSDWLKSLPESFYQKFNKDNVYEIFSSLEKMSANLSILTMYLAFEPDDVTLNQIGLFARKTFNFPSLLLSFKIDPKLIAGVALTWKGVYRDYSLRAKIEERKAEIAEGFKRFLR